jgi:hypothetical protein
LDQVSELADSVEASTELTDDVKQALLRRIAQVRFAIENARIGGPEAVQEAVEQLLGAAIVRSGAVPKATPRRSLLSLLLPSRCSPQGPRSRRRWKRGHKSSRR